MGIKYKQLTNEDIKMNKFFVTSQEVHNRLTEAATHIRNSVKTDFPKSGNFQITTESYVIDLYISNGDITLSGRKSQEDSADLKESFNELKLAHKYYLDVRSYAEHLVTIRQKIILKIKEAPTIIYSENNTGEKIWHCIAKERANRSVAEYSITWENFETLKSPHLIECNGILLDSTMYEIVDY